VVDEAPEAGGNLVQIDGPAGTKKSN
jgi:hypothetical protein